MSNSSSYAIPTGNLYDISHIMQMPPEATSTLDIIQKAVAVGTSGLGSFGLTGALTFDLIGINAESTIITKYIDSADRIDFIIFLSTSSSGKNFSIGTIDTNTSVVTVNYSNNPATSDEYVLRTGDTMTGNLEIDASSAQIELKDTNHNGEMYAGWGAGHKNHGVYSYGYAPTATTWTDDGKWLVYRDASGNVKLNGNADTATSATKATQDGSGNVITDWYYHRPNWQANATSDWCTMPLIRTARPNRLAFLPPDQVIIEQTTNGGSTWTSAGVSDTEKRKLFSGNYDADVRIPLISSKQNTNCGIRITISAMKYNVPSGTAETSKYNYWNSSYVASTNRYCTLGLLWFWVSTAGGTISLKVSAAKGSSSTTWTTLFEDSNFGLSGWSGSDWCRFAENVFGGSTGQTTQYWNYRFEFFTRTLSAAAYQGQYHKVCRITGYGSNCWTSANNMMGVDSLYSWDYNGNGSFPGTATNATNIYAKSGSYKTVANTLLEMVYPVGSVYMSTNSTSPATFLGGTWTQIKGRFLLGVGANTANTVTTYGSLSASAINRSSTKEQGGRTSVQLTLPNYRKRLYIWQGGSGGAGGTAILNGDYIAYGQNYNCWLTDSDNEAFYIMPPYFTVYMWERTA